MEQIERSLALVRTSWEVLRRDRVMIVFPIAAAVVTFALTIAISAVASTAGIKTGNGHAAMPFVLIVSFYFATFLVGTFFHACVLAIAMLRLAGEEPTVGDGFRAAADRLPSLAAWSAIGATFGVVARAVEERTSVLGRAVLGTVGAAWSAVGLFIVPVILCEPGSTLRAIRRSGELFRSRWGETMVGSAGIGLGVFVFSLPIVVFCLLLAAFSLSIALFMGMACIGILAATGAAANGIYTAALYKYATEGEAAEPFEPVDLEEAFRARRQSGWRPGTSRA